MPANACVYQKYPGENVDEMLRRLTKLTAKDNLRREYARAEAFIPHPQRRRAKSSRARAWQRKHGRHYHD